jgi:GTP cyclohydrolase IA
MYLMNLTPYTSCDMGDDDVNEGLAHAAQTLPDLTKMSSLFHELLAEIGEDPARQGLLRTPVRAAKAWDFLTQGYRTDLAELVNGAIFTEKYDEIVAVKHIHFFSMCEHHLLPFYGVCHVAYIPDGKVIGLSKIPRIVDMFARRLQLQERLTKQIAESLNEVLKPRGVAVVMEAYHMCMLMRGVEKQDSRTTTSEMLGAFKDNPQTRQEFLSLMSVNLIH